MRTHHLSRRHGFAILVAVAGLLASAVGAAAALEPSNAKGATPRGDPRGAEQSCHAWVVATNRANGKAGENRTHDVTVNALGQACRSIPEQLRRASGEAQKMKDQTERAATLGTAASAALGAGCSVADPHANAVTVARTCPLPSLPPTFRFRLDEGELARLGAVDYLILNVMMRSLIAANALDESAKVLLLGFTLSAEISREDYQKRAERRHARSR
jgi:hypothetical protein